jgi:hypothetical protein
MPILPATAAATSLKMSPKRVDATMTSNRFGSRTTLAHKASICSWSQQLMPEIPLPGIHAVVPPPFAGR